MGITFGIIVALRLGLCVTAGVLGRRKKQGAAAMALLALFFTPVLVVVALAAMKTPKYSAAELRRMQPSERRFVQFEEKMEPLEKKEAKLKAMRDRLEREVDAMRSDPSCDMKKLESSLKKLEKVRGNWFRSYTELSNANMHRAALYQDMVREKMGRFSVSTDFDPQEVSVLVHRDGDGTLSVELPRSLTEDTLKELESAVRNRYGIPFDDKTSIRVTLHDPRDRRTFGLERDGEFFCEMYDRTRGEFRPAGTVGQKDLTAWNDVKRSVTEVSDSVRDACGDRKDVLNVRLINEDAVALTLDGTAVAVAVPGVNGTVQGRGPVLDTIADPRMRSVAEGIAQQLKPCRNMKAWMEAVKGMCLSEKNLHPAPVVAPERETRNMEMIERELDGTLEEKPGDLGKTEGRSIHAPDFDRMRDMARRLKDAFAPKDDFEGHYRRKL